MFAGLKHSLAAAVSKYAPQLLYYAADRTARKPFRVRVDAQGINILQRRSGKVVRIGRNHALYLADVIECFDYYFSSVRSKLTQEPGGGGGFRHARFSCGGWL